MAAFTIFGHRRAQDSVEPSPFAGLLPRIRGMRGGGVWHALTSPGAVSARCARVADARPHVHDLPPPYIPVDGYHKARRMLRRWFIIILVFIFVGTLAIIFVGARLESARIATGGFAVGYTLPAVPLFLTESVALAHASSALADSGLDVSKWIPVRLDDTERTPGPDGRRDFFLQRTTATIGTIKFRHSDSTNVLRTVNLYLRAASLTCRVE